MTATKLKKVSIPKLDEGWIELFEFQKTFRERHNLTAFDLLRALGLPRTFVQHLYLINPPPSSKPDTKGWQLRERLRALQTNPQVGTFQISSESDFVDKLYDFSQVNKSKLKEHHITGLMYSPTKNMLLVSTDREIEDEEARSTLLKLGGEEYLNNKALLVEKFVPA